MKRALLVVAVLAAPAAAQPAKEAKAHFLQGKAFQDAGQFERAADEYKKAYALDPRPEMLFNIGQAFRLAKKKVEALDYFRQYLAAQPDGAGAAEARTHVATLTKEIDEANTTGRPHVQEPPTITLPLPPEREEAHVSAPVTERDSSSGKGLLVAGLSTAGLGLLSVGLGVKFALDAKSANDYIEGFEGEWTKREEDRFDEGQRANRNMKIAYVVGGVLVAGGGVMFYLGMRAKPAPVVTTQSASLVVVGDF